MSYLLDTNVISEWVRVRPDPSVVEWLADVDEDRVFLSVVTLAELRHGVERMAAGRRRNRLDQWLRGDVPARFEGRLLVVDGAVADEWGVVVAKRAALGRPIGVMDAFIAATANVHGLTVVTRNIEDLQNAALATINPWTGHV